MGERWSSDEAYAVDETLNKQSKEKIKTEGRKKKKGFRMKNPGGQDSMDLPSVSRIKNNKKGRTR